MPHKLFIKIHEDGLSKIGQHKSIEYFMADHNEKYYAHCEEDWIFENSYDWITESLKIMESDPTIIKVLARFDSPHPVEYDKILEYTTENNMINIINYGILKPWKGNDGILWHGFSWNPGVTRLDLLKEFTPFPKWEQELAEQIHDKGYKVAVLSKPIYKHIGENRSTHE